jgi:hypothetical protein
MKFAVGQAVLGTEDPQLLTGRGRSRSSPTAIRSQLIMIISDINMPGIDNRRSA